MKSDVGSAKYQSKQQKLSGLQKLKYYCQLCSKQCRDANGFKNHINSPSHRGRLENTSNGDEDIVKKYSDQFKDAFLRLLKQTHGTKKINANKFYQEYILNDRDHVHMNSTRWTSLTQFVKFLGQAGEVRVENDNQDDELSFTIALIDRSPEAVRRQEMLNNKKKVTKGDEGITMRILKKQMERGVEEEKRNQELGMESIPTRASTESTPPLVSGPIKVALGLKAKLPRKKNVLSAFGGTEDDDEDEDNTAEKDSVLINSKKRKINIKIVK